MHLALPCSTSGISTLPFNSSLQGSSVGLVVRSLNLTSTPQVISASSSMVVTQSNTNNYVVTSTTTQLLTCSQSVTTTGMSYHIMYIYEFSESFCHMHILKNGYFILSCDFNYVCICIISCVI